MNNRVLFTWATRSKIRKIRYVTPQTAAPHLSCTKILRFLYGTISSRVSDGAHIVAHLGKIALTG